MPKFKKRKIFWVLGGAVLLLPIFIAIGILLVSAKPQTFFVFERKISLGAQKVEDSLFAEEGMFVKSGWDGPTGSFTSADIYGVKFGGVLFRLDVVHDPIAAVKARLPKDPLRLTALLSSKKLFVSRCAAEALVDLGPNAAGSIPEMLRLYGQGELEMESYVVDLVKRAGDSAIPFLSEGLYDAAAPIRRLSAVCAGELGPEASALIERLGTLLDSQSDEEILAAASALRKVATTDRRAIPKMLELVKGEAPAIKFNAVQILGEYGEDGAPAIPVLLPILDSKDFGERIVAITTLGQIGVPAEKAIPKLVTMVNDPSLSYAAIQALCSMGTNGVRAFIQLYSKIDPNMFLAKMNALSALGPKAEESVPLLLEDLETAKGIRRALIAMALGKIGEKARVAIPRLETLLTDTHPQTRLRAAEALWNLERRTNVVLPLMLTELQSWASNTNALRGRTSDATRESREQLAARVLGEIGPAAKDAEAHLELMTRSSFEEMRTTARKSLARIRKKPTEQ